MNRNTAGLLLLAFALALATAAEAAPAPPPATSTTYYVATTGSDSQNGTASSPWATITHAAANVGAGATVTVAPGTYNGNVVTNVSGTAMARIQFISEKQFGAKIVGTGTGAMWANRGSYIDIVGFDVSGSGRLGIMNEGSHTRIMGNLVHNLSISGGCTNNGGAGIDDGNYSASDDDIIGNIVGDIGVPGSCNFVQGIYHSNLGGHIYNNIVYRSAAWGIHLWHAAKNVMIANNIAFANGGRNGAGVCLGGGIVVGDGDSPGGIVDDDTTVANNIVYQNECSAIREAGSTGPKNRYINNILFGNGTNSIRLLTGQESGTITADPMFVNYQANGSGNYQLRPGSPGIAAGTGTFAPAYDIDGRPRPSGNGYDIGAYQTGRDKPAWPWYTALMESADQR